MNKSKKKNVYIKKIKGGNFFREISTFTKNKSLQKKINMSETNKFLNEFVVFLEKHKKSTNLDELFLHKFISTKATLGILASPTVKTYEDDIHNISIYLESLKQRGYFVFTNSSKPKFDELVEYMYYYNDLENNIDSLISKIKLLIQKIIQEHNVVPRTSHSASFSVVPRASSRESPMVVPRASSRDSPMVAPRASSRESPMVAPSNRTRRERLAAYRENYSSRSLARVARIDARRIRNNARKAALSAASTQGNPSPSYN